MDILLVQSTSSPSTMRGRRPVDVDLAEQWIDCCFTLLPEEETLVCGGEVLIPYNISQERFACYCSLASLGQSQSSLTFLVGKGCSLADLPVLTLLFISPKKVYSVTHLEAVYSFSPSLLDSNFV